MPTHTRVWQVPEKQCVACVCHHNRGLMGLLSVAPGRAGEQLCVCNVPPQTLTLSKYNVLTFCEFVILPKPTPREVIVKISVLLF